jgi:4-aminobutyrate aminotransferase/(S)-3-amino-2-methylpropionate transaminase
MPYAYCYRCPLTYLLRRLRADHLETFFIGNAAELTAVIAGRSGGGFVTPPNISEAPGDLSRHGIVLIIDEVQTGMGGLENCSPSITGVAPDIIVLAKSLAAGSRAPSPGARAHEQAACGAGRDIQREPDLLPCRARCLGILRKRASRARRGVGAKDRARFEELRNRFEIVGDVRGKGPMMAIEPSRPEDKDPGLRRAKKLVRICYERGLVLISRELRA